jgi:lipopolysaccharide export system protein LptA
MSGRSVYAQKEKKEKKSKKEKKEKIELEHADNLEGDRFNGKKINKFLGNVVFSQKGTKLYCDSAYQYINQNVIEAFGRVRIVQGDSLNLTGDRLTYDGDTKKAVMTGKVFLRDKTMTLSTTYLEYNLSTKTALYLRGGTINDGQVTLSSESGSYSTESKIFRFRKNVKVVNPAKDYTLTSDTLHYNTVTNIATFLGPTKIVSSQGNVTSDVGEYNTQTGEMTFRGRKGNAEVTTPSYQLTGDEIYFDEKRNMGVAKRNVRLYSEKDKIIVEGDMAHYWGDKGISKVFGNILMKSVVGEDTLYLTADTLISIDSPDPKEKRLLAFHRTTIYKSDLQGICDSLAYNFSDSTIYFYRDPVLWSGKTQITADSINIQLEKNEIKRLNLTLNSFLISQDTLYNFNQIKGRNMTAHFRNGNIYRVDVNGNGETVYFALEDDKKLTGLNKVACSNMIIRLDSNKVKSISFLKKPDGKFFPPHEIAEPEKRLKGFAWRSREKPDLRIKNLRNSS